jgi:hypothetical protein
MSQWRIDIYIDIIAPNYTKCYRQIVKTFKFMFFMDGTQKKMKLSRKVITHPSFASFFVCEIKDSELPITKSFWILIIDTVDVQITKWLHLSFFIFIQLGRGMVAGGWLYLINSLKKNTKKHRQPPSCIVKFLQILCSSCIHLILVIL